MILNDLSGGVLLGVVDLLPDTPGLEVLIFVIILNLVDIGRSLGWGCPSLALILPCRQINLFLITVRNGGSARSLLLPHQSASVALIWLSGLCNGCSLTLTL